MANSCVRYAKAFLSAQSIGYHIYYSCWRELNKSVMRVSWTSRRFLMCLTRAIAVSVESELREVRVPIWPQRAKQLNYLCRLLRHCRPSTINASHHANNLLILIHPFSVQTTAKNLISVSALIFLHILWPYVAQESEQAKSRSKERKLYVPSSSYELSLICYIVVEQVETLQQVSELRNACDDLSYLTGPPKSDLSAQWEWVWLSLERLR